MVLYVETQKRTAHSLVTRRFPGLESTPSINVCTTRGLVLLIDTFRYSRAAACENIRMRARINEIDKTVANRQPCSVATDAHMSSVRFSAGEDAMLEPQNYSRVVKSARAAQVAHSSEQAAHAQACLRDTCCPFWLHSAQRRLQRRDLTRAPLPCTHKRIICT